MKDTLIIVQSVLSVLLILFIVVQARGTGLGRSGFGSGSSFTRRGLEKLIFRSTFVLLFLFLVVSILSLFA